MTDNTVRLHYFNGRGLAHIIRYTLAAAGVEYIEQTIATPEQLQDLQEQGLLYWQQLPLLQIDGRNLVQSNAIVRYLARKYHLYGANDDEAVLIDIIYDGLTDVYLFANGYIFAPDKPSRLHTIIEKSPRYLEAVSRTLASSASGFLVGKSLSIADLRLLEVVETLGHLCPDVVDKYPFLREHQQKLKELPNIADFFNGPHQKPVPDEVYAKTVDAVLRR